MKKTIISFLFLFILSLGLVQATGLCTLDKTNYNPGEIITLTCSCTSPQEEGRPGYIVWMQDNGTILQSVSTNSGACTNSLFGGSYLFLSGANFTGNASFTLNADGSGIPLQWDGLLDVRSDTFNVSGPSSNECIITDIKIPSQINLGQENANVFKVSDSVTGNPIVGINCVAIAYSADDSPILIEPYGENYDNYRSVAGGVGYLINTFEQERFKTGVSYKFDLYCQCTNNSENDAVCYDGTTGERLGFKSCSVTGLFTISKNNKTSNLNSLYYILVLVAILTFISYITKNLVFIMFDGIFLLLSGLIILTINIDGLNTLQQQSLGIATSFIGFALLLWLSVKKITDKYIKKNKQEIEIEIDK